MEEKKMEHFSIIDFLSTFLKLIQISKSHMLSCLMELQMHNSAVIYWKCITQSWLLCMVFSILFLFSLMMFQKFHLFPRWFNLTRQYIICLYQEYLIIPIPYSNQNLMNFIIGILAYSVGIIPEWRGILWGCTKTWSSEKYLLP